MEPPPATEPVDPGRTARLMRAATYASVTVASVLIVAKLVVWVLSDSVALLGSLIDSALDLMASLISLYAVHQALTPADAEHRFGHGKAESLAALGQSVFVGGSALFLLYAAGARLLNPQAIEYGGAAVGVMVLSLVLTMGLVRFQHYVINQTGSVAITADSLHYTADILVNGGIIAGLLAVTVLGWTLIDPLVAVGVASYLIVTAWAIARTSLDMLMDRELGEDARKTIREITLSHPEVRAIHELRTRSAGMHSFIQFHLELDGDLTLTEAHQIADEVERMVTERFPEAEILIHEDPAGIEEEHPGIA